jgi:hypothetical protein
LGDPGKAGPSACVSASNPMIILSWHIDRRGSRCHPDPRETLVLRTGDSLERVVGHEEKLQIHRFTLFGWVNTSRGIRYTMQTLYIVIQPVLQRKSAQSSIPPFNVSVILAWCLESFGHWKNSCQNKSRFC